MTALVLGSTGFIGRALVRRLEASGERVIGHSSATLDLRRAESLQRLTADADATTTLYMLASLTPRRAVGLSGLADNLAMVLNLASWLEHAHLRKCVYISSDAVYPMRAEPIDETAPVEPDNLYALSKFNGERILDHTARARGVPLLILRPSAVYGPGDPHNGYGPNRFARAIAEGHPVQLFGQGEEERDHIFVDDVALVASRLAASDVDGVFNVVTGTSRSFASVVDDFRALAPVSFSVEHLPRSGPITHRWFDTARLRAALPDVCFTIFTDGLSMTLAAAIDARSAVVHA